MKPRSKVAALFVGLLCIVLAVFMTVEIAHSHAEIGAAGHCPLCASAHLATGVVPAWLTPFVLLLLGIVSIGESSPGSRPVLVTSFIRPPPARPR